MADDVATRARWFDDELAASRSTVLRAIDQLDQLRSDLEAEAERSLERRAELRALVYETTRRDDDRRNDASSPYTGQHRRSTDDPDPNAEAGPPIRDRRRPPVALPSEPIAINQQRFRD